MSGRNEKVGSEIAVTLAPVSNLNFASFDSNWQLHATECLPVIPAIQGKHLPQILIVIS